MSTIKGNRVRMTQEQVADLKERLDRISPLGMNGNIAVEVVQATDGRLQFYTIEVKETLRALKK